MHLNRKICVFLRSGMSVKKGGLLQNCFVGKKPFFKTLCTKRRLIFYYKGAYAAPLYPRRRVRPGAM